MGLIENGGGSGEGSHQCRNRKGSGEQVAEVVVAAAAILSPSRVSIGKWLRQLHVLQQLRCAQITTDHGRDRALQTHCFHSRLILNNLHLPPLESAKPLLLFP